MIRPKSWRKAITPKVGKVIETIYGKFHKYEIVRNVGLISTDFVIHRDGEYWKGAFSTLPEAVDAAKKAG